MHMRGSVVLQCDATGGNYNAPASHAHILQADAI